MTRKPTTRFLYISRKERKNSIQLQLTIRGWDAVRVTYLPKSLTAKFWLRNEHDLTGWIKAWTITNIDEYATIQFIRALYSNLKEFPVQPWDAARDGDMEYGDPADERGVDLPGGGG